MCLYNCVSKKKPVNQFKINTQNMSMSWLYKFSVLNHKIIDHSHNWCIHVEDRSHLTENEAQL